MASRRITIQPTGFTSSKVEGRLIAGKGGRGVFAREKVRKGDMIVVWGGEVVTGETLRAMSEDRLRLALQVEDDLFLLTTSEGAADWVNHSCDPNAGLDGQIVLVALRDIRAGEEITFDYATSDASPYDEFECGCGSRICRGHIGADDWQLPDLQQRYAGHFSPYIQRRIDEMNRVRARKSVRAGERRTASLSRRS